MNNYMVLVPAMTKTRIRNLKLNIIGPFTWPRFYDRSVILLFKTL